MILEILRLFRSHKRKKKSQKLSVSLAGNHDLEEKAKPRAVPLFAHTSENLKDHNVHTHKCLFEEIKDL